MLYTKKLSNNTLLQSVCLESEREWIITQFEWNLDFLEEQASQFLKLEDQFAAPQIVFDILI